MWYCFEWFVENDFVVVNIVEVVVNNVVVVDFVNRVVVVSI